jgi:hypothetical protein
MYILPWRGTCIGLAVCISSITNEAEMISKSTIFAAVVGLALSFAGAGANATNLVTNGSFETLSNGIGQIGYNGNSLLSGWTNGSYDGNSSHIGYNFVYSAGSADTTGANGVSGNVKLWGPGDGSNNGLPATSPDGGNYIAADGAYQTAPISQTINGLTSGTQYTVSFWYAGAQQQGFDGVTTEKWLVSLGGQQLSTATLTDPSHGFTGWQYATLTFTATSSSSVLSFLAAGTPGGEPPFSLLDGVTLSAVSAVPEPTSAAIMLTGLLAVGLLVRRRQLSPAAN